MKSVPEEELIKRAKEGDREAWGHLYELYIDKVYRYIASRVEPMEAEDITEQVFLKAFQSIHSFKLKGIPFSSFLFTLARNLLIDWKRKEGARQRYITKEIAPPQFNPEEMAEKRMMMEEMKKAIDKLTPAQQEVIRLRFAAGLSCEETAKIMGKSIGAIKALQHTALNNLRRMLYV